MSEMSAAKVDANLALDAETLEIGGMVAYGSLTTGHGAHELASSGDRRGWSTRARRWPGSSGNGSASAPIAR